MDGSRLLSSAQVEAHPRFEIWRGEVRNKITADVDPDVEIWKADVAHWPFTVDELTNELLRVIERFRASARQDPRAKMFFIPPTELGPDVIGLTGQEGRSWAEA